jgi:hypothetical protein
LDSARIEVRARQAEIAVTTSTPYPTSRAPFWMTSPPPGLLDRAERMSEQAGFRLPLPVVSEVRAELARRRSDSMRANRAG